MRIRRGLFGRRSPVGGGLSGTPEVGGRQIITSGAWLDDAGGQGRRVLVGY